jgi:hypothetical protein
LRSKAFITAGIETSTNWWYGNCYTAYGLYETVADDGETREISFLMGENYRVKKVDFRRYTVRLDGFFSWYGDKDAYAVTKPFVLNGENMFINFETSVTGGLVVCFIRFLCHFVSGVTIWSGYAPENMLVGVYSLVYNGSYMLIETIITIIGLTAISAAFNFKKKNLA